LSNEFSDVSRSVIYDIVIEKLGIGKLPYQKCVEVNDDWKNNANV